MYSRFATQVFVSGQRELSLLQLCPSFIPSLFRHSSVAQIRDGLRDVFRQNISRNLPPFRLHLLHYLIPTSKQLRSLQLLPRDVFNDSFKGCTCFPKTPLLK